MLFFGGEALFATIVVSHLSDKSVAKVGHPGSSWLRESGVRKKVKGTSEIDISMKN